MKKIPAEKLRLACREILRSLGVRDDVAHEVTECLVETSLRGVDTHGFNLLPHYVSVVRSGRINKNPRYAFSKTSASTGTLDADHTFGHAAASGAVKEALALADAAGSGFVAVRNSTHFSAASYYALQAARRDMIGMAFTNTSSAMVPTRGTKPFFGTNPMCFAFPCEGEEPICLDMATTQIAWNKVKRAKLTKAPLDGPWATDARGKATQSSEAAVGLVPAGLHKGYGLALVVEVLCSLLSGGALYGPHLPGMFENLSERRYLGHFVGAIQISSFVPVPAFKSIIKKMVDELRDQPASDPELPVLVAGDPEKQSFAQRSREGIPVEDLLFDDLQRILAEQGLAGRIELT
jgi:ureidoglycolate dehydrogenase (NAD+)